MRRILRRLLRIVVVAFLVFYASCLVGLAWARTARPPGTMVQLQRRIAALIDGRPYRVDRIWVDLDDLPAHAWRAVVAAEDSRFFEHHGFDWVEITDAREEMRRGERRRGASTITQQLVKNLFLSTRGAVVRKAVEISLTPAAEVLLPKRRILELYVNEIEWGPGIFGIEAAARHHFGVSARQLTREQAASLAALIPAPLRRTTQSSAWYAEIILQRMRAKGW